MVIVKEIRYSGGACPFQVSFITENNQFSYLRYRNGELMVLIVNDDSSFGDDYIFKVKIGDDLDGSANHDLFVRHLKSIIKFPDNFIMSSDADKSIP